MLAFQNDAQVSLELPGLQASFEEVAVAGAKFDLSFALAEERAGDGAPAGLAGVLEYAADLFDEATVRAIAARLVRLLAAAVAEPDRAIGSLDILSADERHTILTAWNDTARTIPHTTIPELFAQQAARTPDAVALVFDDATLSYRELDTRSNQLAHHLRTLGAGPETIVGLCVERSFDMVIALIGILKAGAAYLPLDPDYPQQRLRFMLDDAAAPILSPTARCGPASPSITPASLISTPTAPCIAPQPADCRRLGRIDLDHRRLRHLHLRLDRTTQGRQPIPHCGLANRLAWMQDAYRHDAGRRRPAADTVSASTRRYGNLSGR